MNAFEVFLSASSLSAAAFSVLYVNHLIKVSGRDRPHNPELVHEFVRTAPMERLDNVFSKS